MEVIYILSVITKKARTYQGGPRIAERLRQFILFFFGSKRKKIFSYAQIIKLNSKEIIINNRIETEESQFEKVSTL